MNPVRLAHKEPHLCDHNALDMAEYRCIFWGPLTGAGVSRKKGRLLRYATVDFIFSDPTLILMGAWLQINERSMPNT